MSIRILTESQRSKQDSSNDFNFYAYPKLVHHLDQNFREHLTQIYRENLREGSIILDLMSSWVSHLPQDIKFSNVIGHGMNEIELIQNKRLNSYWIQNLNESQNLPFNDNSFDSVLITAGWQYLQYPENIAEEIRRIMRPTGKLIISFTNRAFWHKATKVWIESSTDDQFNYISEVLLSNGWSDISKVIYCQNNNSWFNFFHKASDPFYCVIAS